MRQTGYRWRRGRAMVAVSAETTAIGRILRGKLISVGVFANDSLIARAFPTSGSMSWNKLEGWPRRVDKLAVNVRSRHAFETIDSIRSRQQKIRRCDHVIPRGHLLVAYDYGAGTQWALVRAASREEV